MNIRKKKKNKKLKINKNNWIRILKINLKLIQAASEQIVRKLMTSAATKNK
jgi:hypothetical protein